uniref:Uncharacterized protein n=1 Tax=Ciona intestinalis TaxID=7719 RepID=H2XPS9_CIOIN
FEQRLQSTSRSIAYPRFRLPLLELILLHQESFNLLDFGDLLRSPDVIFHLGLGDLVLTDDFGCRNMIITPLGSNVSHRGVSQVTRREEC